MPNLGYRFYKYNPTDGEGTPFENLLKIFKDLLLHTSGDVQEALSWLTELDRQYQLTDANYGIADFIKDLERNGFIEPQGGGDGGDGFSPTRKMEIELRKKSLEDVFGILKKAKRGNHNTNTAGRGDEFTSDLKPYEFGDAPEHIAMSTSMRNAQINSGLDDDFRLTQQDLEVYETFFQSQTSTVLMIDISHSMTLYGEDRITPAKKVAMALSELIMTKYPKDTLDIIVFGNDAWQIDVKDLPYLQNGPYYTNTVAGLELAMDLLRRRKNPNKQIFMITDGKPTCIKRGKEYYQNSWGLDRMVINRTIGLGVRCRKLGIPVTTFMIARDAYLQQFVEEFTKANNGKAFYSTLQGLGEYIFSGYKTSKKKR